MAGITGIGSGMDIDAMVGALVAAEKAPKEAQLTRLATATTTKISALGTLRTALSSFQTALKDLNDVKLFENRSAKSSSTDLLTATASKTAQSGTYSVKIEQLATGSKTATAALESDFTTGVAGTLTIKVGDGEGVAVDLGEGASLTQVKDALNATLEGSGVTANLLTDPSTGKARLVMSSTNTGEGKDVSIATSAGLEALAIDTGGAATAVAGGVLERAQNAKFTIDGLALQSATNKVEGAIPDVALDLVSADKDKTVTITVAQDKEGVSANIKKFVTAYNNLIKTTNSLTKVTKVGEDGQPLAGGLVGDSSVRSILSGVQSELTSVGGSDGVRMLSDLGITTQKDGTLAVDDKKLDTALEKNFSAVGGFFTGEAGLMNRLNSRVEGFNQSGGILAQRVSGLEATNADIKTQREKLDLRIESMSARLYAQFNAMDTLVAQLANTSSWLENTLSSLPGVVKKQQ
ncbi:flagellar hook-associated 2 domain-containing protein [Stutzerimonas stutzeri]|uniref:flagellar filament capping protein FliD n=1 Tax=Stutzerimonas stutzeri subgroup TaxID=578833 RepID=UPI000F6F2171|nr:MULTISPECIES: flagellar filament capping protein FliD [Stutzerimonas stutzeri subgroup]MCQ2045978.1 flagellar filament capping protein FliD [Stutzerimonas kunmingensis]QQC09492.1 flagellar filament capping protein FliD [Stutzerimonas stutzeri]VEI35071.1 flagellar hook-associated 2 domain-containing protein [Stutzerimonas stutzeri]